MASLRKLTTIIMAGGKGTRLSPLTRDKAKPAITFGSIYRIIDFTLSNCINSGIRRIYVLSQYGNFSLDYHLKLTWDILNPELNEFIWSIPPQQIHVNRWYRGTADSIYQNLPLLEQERPEYVLILSGDHVYRMDYQEMIDFHVARGADMTVATVPVPRAEGSSFGIIKIDENAAVLDFLEKPDEPPGMPDNPDFALVSMGVYVFKGDVLAQEVIKDAKKKSSSHDFGKDIIPQMVGRKKVFAFNFMDKDTGKPRYWRDIGLLDAYFQAHRELMGPKPDFELFDPKWEVRGRPQMLPPSKYISPEGVVCVENSLIASGCIIEGSVSGSVLSPSVKVRPGAVVDECIIWEGAEIREGARVRRAIIEDGVKVPPRFSIGYHKEDDAQRFEITEGGIVIVPNNAVLD